MCVCVYVSPTSCSPPYTLRVRPYRIRKAHARKAAPKTDPMVYAYAAAAAVFALLVFALMVRHFCALLVPAP